MKGSVVLLLSVILVFDSIFNCKAASPKVPANPDFKYARCESVIRKEPGKFRDYYIENHEVQGIQVYKESRYNENLKSLVTKVCIGEKCSEYSTPVSACPRSKSTLPTKYLWGEENQKTISWDDLFRQNIKDARESSQVTESKCRLAQLNIEDVRIVANAVCGKPGNTCEELKDYYVGKYIIVEKVVRGTFIVSVSRYDEKYNSYVENVCYKNSCDKKSKFDCDNFSTALP